MKERLFPFALILAMCLPLLLGAQTMDSVRVSSILIVGNQRTKPSVIERELDFCVNQVLALKDFKKRIQESRINLMNTKLFNFVDIVPVYLDTNKVGVTISVQERWFFIPQLRVKSIEQNVNAWAENANFSHLTLSGMVTDENFRGMNEKLSLMGSVGFNKSAGIKYFSPNLWSKRKLGFGVELEWISNEEAIYGLFDFKPKFFRSEGNTVLSQLTSSVSLFYRPTLHLDELLAVTFKRLSFGDTLILLNPGYFLQPDLSIVRLYSKTKFDFRDSKAYPLNGSYFDLILEKQWSVQRNAALDIGSLIANGRWFGQISNNGYAAFGVTVASSVGTENAHFFGFRIGQAGLEVRSYEYYQIPINHAFIGKVELKRRLINREKNTFSFLGNPKFSNYYYAIYATLFADGAWIDNQQESNYQQRLKFDSQWLSSTGVGLDVSTYYDIVARVEYSYNFVFQKWNWFIHFKASI